MEFIENSRKQEENEGNITITTNISYTFFDGQVVTVDIPHFNPQNEYDIQKGIINRYITELRYYYPSVTDEAIQQMINYTNQ